MMVTIVMVAMMVMDRGAGDDEWVPATATIDVTDAFV